MQWVWHDGALQPEGTPLFTAANRGFKWGDGVFETAKFYRGRLLLAAYHFDRLFEGLRLLEIPSDFTPHLFETAIAELCEANGCSLLARVRLALYRGESGAASCIVEATALSPQTMEWNTHGWKLVTYPHAQKSCDVFANIKSANYLPYLMAGRYAAANNVNESLVLNAHGRICDGSKTNIFTVKDGVISTPPLMEGGVAGVVRRYLLQQAPELHYKITEQPLTETQLHNADAVFVTNAIEGLRWVCEANGRFYEHGFLKKLYSDALLPLYHEAAG